MNKRLKVFEAFAGIGAQVTALNRIGIDYEVVGISEWYIDAILCYDILHNEQSPMEVPTYEKQLEYLRQFEFSKDSVRPTDISKLKKEDLEKLFIANKRSKNLGSITQIKSAEIPTTDLFIYSFPCQDLSTGGKGLGMKKGSNTRSGLLWEVERILKELNDENRLPEYLLLENVKTILAQTNRKDLNQWLDFLCELGYINDAPIVLNAKDFNIPQDRERTFIASRLQKKMDIADKIVHQERKYSIYDFIKNDYSIEKYKENADEAQLNNTPSRETMWEINGMEINENTVIRTITCNMDRTHCAGLFRYNGRLGDTYRRPTIREAFLFMGFTEEEYERTLPLKFSYRKMNKLIGNSIVVNVLSEVLQAMLGEWK